MVTVPLRNRYPKKSIQVWYSKPRYLFGGFQSSPDFRLRVKQKLRVIC